VSYIIPRGTLHAGDSIRIRDGALTIIREGPVCGKCGHDGLLDEFCDVPRCADVLACLDRRSKPRAGGASGG
jgi:hypothetical protein